MSQSDTSCYACSTEVKATKKSFASAMLIPKLSVGSNWFCTVDGKYDFTVFLRVPHVHTSSPSTYFSVKERNQLQICEYTRDQSIIQSINHLRNACLSDVCNTFILMDYMHYVPAADLICIPRCADDKITLLMHWFSPSKIDGTDEQKGTTN